MTLKEKLKLLADIRKRNDQCLKDWLAKKKA
jgi:hypothetical protein